MTCNKCKDNHKVGLNYQCKCKCHKVVYIQKKEKA